MPKKLIGLRDALILKIKALYDIEEEIIKALPNMAKKADDEELREALLSHLEETKNHAMRLNSIFEILGEKPAKTKVEAIRGLIDDGNWVAKVDATLETKDAMIIAACQYIEHYEMAGYGSAREWARVLGEEEVADLLEDTLDEEKAADLKLNSLGTQGINEKAAAQDEEEAGE